MKNNFLLYCLVAMLLAATQIVKAQNKGEFTTEDKTVSRSYEDLLQSEASIKAEIESINAMLPSLSSSKAKKATKRLLELDAMYESIQKRKSYYPESVTNSSQTQQEDEDLAREEVRKMVEEKFLERGGSLNEDFDSDTNVNPSYWTIVISISSNPNLSKYEAYGDVHVENMGDKYVFFVGNYSSKAEADERCKQIVKKGKCRDAFVVKRGE